MNHKPGFVVPPPENSAPQFGPSFSLSPNPATPPIHQGLQDAYYSIPQYPNQPLESIPVLPYRKSNGLTIESINGNKGLYNSPDLHSIRQTPVPKFRKGLTLELMNRNAELYNSSPNGSLHSIQQYPNQHHGRVPAHKGLTLEPSLHSIKQHPNQREGLIPVQQFRKSNGLTIESINRNKALYKSPDLQNQDVSLHSDIPTSHLSTLPIREGLSWDNTNFSSTSIPKGTPCWVVKSKDKLMTINGNASTASENPKPVIMSSQQPTEENTPSTVLTSFPQLIDIDNSTQPTIPTSFSQLIDIDNSIQPTIPTSFSQLIDIDNSIQPTVPITSFTQLIDSSWMGWNFTNLLMDEGFGLDSVTVSNPGIFTDTARDESAVRGFQPVYNLNSPPVPEADAIYSGTHSLQFAMPTPDEGQYHLSTDENSTQDKDFVVPSENVNGIGISEAANISAEAIKDRNILQQQEEGKKGIDLNKTPKQKTPKKRKHRPKVIIEGKDIRNPKKAKGLKKTTTSPDEKKKSGKKRNRVEMENGTTNSKEKKLNSKRKFARKNEEPIVEHQRETGTKSSSRKALEFDLEIEQNLEEIQGEAGNDVYETEQHHSIARSSETGQQHSNHVSSQLTAAQENLFHGIRQTDENSKILEGFPLLNAKRDSSDKLVNGPELLKEMRTRNGFLQMAASTTLNSPPPTVPNWLISSVNDTFTSNSADDNSQSEVAKQNTHQQQSLASFQLDAEKSQSSDHLCNTLGMPNTDQPSSRQNQNALPVGYHPKGKKPSQIKGSQKKHLEKGTPSKIVVTVKDKQKHTVSNKKGLQLKEKKKRITVPQLISRLKELSIIDYSETGKMPLVPYNAGAVVPYKGNRRKRPDHRVEVYLDPETDRVWKLLMGNNEGSNANSAEDKESEKWWDDERKVFHGRVQSFIARMDLVQGKRRFSPWKGSVVDSVIGVFLTQNVSDHLSSSAYMSLLAKYGVHKKSTVQNWFQGESSVSKQAPIIHENLFTPVSEKKPECPSNSCSKQVVEDFGSSDNPNCCIQVHDEVISWVEPNSKPETRMNQLHYPSSSTHLHTDQTTTFEEWTDQPPLFHSSTDQCIQTNAPTEVRRQFNLLDRYDDAKYLSTGAFLKTDFYPGNERVSATPEKATGSFGLFRDERNCSMSPYWSEVSNSKMNSSKNIGDQAKSIIQTIINRSTTLSETPGNGSSAAGLSKYPFREQLFPISSHYINKSTNSADIHNQAKPSSLQQQIGFNRVPQRHEQISRKIQTGDGQQIPISPNKGIFLSAEMSKLDYGGRQHVPISPHKRILLSDEIPRLDNGSRQQVSISPNKRTILPDEMPKLDNGGRQQVPVYKRQTISPDKRIFVAEKMPILENGGRQQVPTNNVQAISPDERIFVANEMRILENGRRQQVPNDPMYKRQTSIPDKSISVADDILKLDNGAVGAIGINAKERVHSSGESNHGKTVNSSSKKKAKTEDEKKAHTFDWDSLRREVEANGKRKERCSDTMDSLDYEAIRKANVNDISNAIKERGMNNMLAGRIKKFLDRLVGEHGAADLEWLRDIPPNKAKDYLLSFNGLGLKSVECVRLLTLHQLAFPVDTNVGRIAVRLGWVPLRPLPESLQLHLLDMYPVQETIQKYLWPRLCKLDQLTLYQLHYQMITFGKVFCTKSKPNCNACPLRGECRHFASALASTRLLPGPEEEDVGKIVTTNVPTPVKIQPLQLPSANNSIPEETASTSRTCEPIVEEPASPEPERVEITQSDIEDAFYEDPDEIPTIKLNLKEFTQNLQSYMQENMEQQESDFSKALIALTPEIASIPAAKLKNVSRLRTEHQVYELPDSHFLLNELERREPDDPSPYLLAIWTPGETASSTQLPERSCGSQDRNNLCNENTCFSCNSIREANAQIVRGTLMIPCRTAMKGSFPLNGTYFQVNEMFADHESSVNPINVPRSSVWNLPRRTVCFGTSVTSIFKGLSTEKIQKIFWEGFICVRGFDRKTRVPRPLLARLHFPASKSVKVKNDAKKEVNPGLVEALKKKVLDDLTKKQ